MIYLRTKKYTSLILFLLFIGCSYNYEKNLINKNINPAKVIINAKSIKVNKDFKKSFNNSDEYTEKVNDRLVKEFEIWVYKKFKIKGNENEATVNILLAESSLLKDKNKTGSFFKNFLYKEEFYKINLDFNLVIHQQDAFSKKIHIKSSIKFSLFDTMTLSNRENVINNQIKKLIKKIDEKITQDLQNNSFKSVIKIK